MKKTAFLFPGQGTQSIGMLKTDLWYDIGDLANEVLDYNLSHICQNGPIETLNSTLISQPAIFVSSVITLEEFKEAHPDTKPYATAGLSLGEYTALYAAGILEFRDALKLVQRRAELMQEAADNSKGGMVSIMGLSKAKVIDLCAKASWGEYLTLANFNSPTQIVISGDIEACNRVVMLAKNFGAIAAVKLDVEGAFHSHMMYSIIDDFGEVVCKTNMNFSTDVKVVSNIDGKYYESIEEIREGLINQMTNPVMWHECMKRLINDGVEEFYEVGPQRTLTGLMKRIDRSQKIVNVVELLER